MTGNRRSPSRGGSPTPPKGYHAKINILVHAYLYTGDAKHLRAAACAVSSFVDHVYRGPDPRYRGRFITHHSNLDPSYFMQEVPYYLTALAKLGHEPKPIRATRTSVRALSREDIGGKQRYVFDARIRQAKDEPFPLGIEVHGYAAASYDVEVTPVGMQEALTGNAALTKQERAVTITIDIPQDGKLECALRVLCDQNFFVNVPITKEQPGLKEVYSIFREGTWIGDEFRFFFDVPPDATAFTMRYKGRS